MIAKEQHKQKLVLKYKAKRAALRAIMKDQKSSKADKLKANFQLQKLPLRSSPCRLRNRCMVTGRPRGYMRRYGLSRSMVRYYALKGDIPGLRLASW